jgi:hypothetical protein
MTLPMSDLSACHSVRLSVDDLALVLTIADDVLSSRDKRILEDAVRFLSKNGLKEMTVMFPQNTFHLLLETMIACPATSDNFREISRLKSVFYHQISL